MPATEGRITPIQAKSSDSTETGSAKAPLQVADGPAPVMRRIRKLITDDYPEAQRLAAEATERFPGEAEIREANKVLNGPKGPVGTASPEPATDDEIAWLRNPPDSARGKWVALAGRELLAAADKLSDLIEILRSQRPRKRALVHRVE